MRKSLLIFSHSHNPTKILILILISLGKIIFHRPLVQELELPNVRERQTQ